MCDRFCKGQTMGVSIVIRCSIIFIWQGIGLERIGGFHLILEKLHFTTLNYPLDYTLHPKLSDCTLCTLNYHTYHALHPGVIFTVIFNRILLHVTSTCFLLRWNKVKRLKHPSSKLIKTKLKFFYISLYLTWGHPLHLHYFY